MNFPGNLTDCAVICKSKFYIDLKMPKSKAEDFDCKIKFVRICWKDSDVVVVIINYLFWKDNDLLCVLFRVIVKSLWIKKLLYFYCKLKHSHKILKCCLIGLDDTHCPGGKCPELMSARCQTRALGRNSYSRCSSTWLNRCSARR